MPQRFVVFLIFVLVALSSEKSERFRCRRDVQVESRKRGSMRRREHEGSSRISTTERHFVLVFCFGSVTLRARLSW
jgi:hypothetical protein